VGQHRESFYRRFSGYLANMKKAAPKSGPCLEILMAKIDPIISSWLMVSEVLEDISQEREAMEQPKQRAVLSSGLQTSLRTE
jgi:hypothetical protein